MVSVHGVTEYQDDQVCPNCLGGNLLESGGIAVFPFYAPDVTSYGKSDLQIKTGFTLVACSTSFVKFVGHEFTLCVFVTSLITLGCDALLIFDLTLDNWTWPV